MTATLALGALRATHVRLWHPWKGRWSADVDIDLDKTKAVPSGAQALTIGAATLSGTVDSARSGRFGEKATLRLLGGAGGWHLTVPNRDYHNDAGVLSTDVFSTTASEVGETVTDASPIRFGVDYARIQGPASDVLELDGRDWFVDLTGKTVVGARPAATLPKSAEVLTWDGAQQMAEVSSDEVIIPGTSVTDDRFGTITFRDVAQDFSDGAARATAFCGSPNSRLIDAIGALIDQRGRTHLLGKYFYRVVINGVDGRLSLQSVEPVRGVPDLLLIDVWAGIPGLQSTLTLGSQVVVEFIAGDPARPIVTSFQPGQVPPSVTLNAGEVRIGGATATPLAVAQIVDAQLTALKNAISSWSPVTGDGGAALKALLATLIGTGWPASTAATKAKGV